MSNNVILLAASSNSKYGNPNDTGCKQFNYVDHMPYLIGSIRRAMPDQEICVSTVNATPEQQDKIEKRKVHYTNIDIKDQAEAIIRGYSESFFAMDKVIKQYKKVLFLDTDMVILQSLDKIFNLCPNDKPTLVAKFRPNKADDGKFAAHVFCTNSQKWVKLVAANLKKYAQSYEMTDQYPLHKKTKEMYYGDQLEGYLAYKQLESEMAWVNMPTLYIRDGMNKYVDKKENLIWHAKGEFLAPQWQAAAKELGS